MALTVFQVLDKAIEAGGVGLTATALTGRGRSNSGVLEQACSERLLEKTGGKNPKYTLTSAGRQTWEKEAPEDRLRQVQESSEAKKKQELVNFLILIREKGRKVLTKAAEGKYPVALRNEALKLGLVEKGAKEAYSLLLAGKEYLLAQQPLDEQLKQLRQMFEETSTRWHAAQLTLRNEASALAGPDLDGAVNELAARGMQAGQAFDHALKEASAFASVVSAGQRLRETIGLDAQKVEAARTRLQEDAKRQKEELEEAFAQKVKAARTRLQEEAARQKEELEAFERRFGQRLDEITRCLDTTAQPAAQVNSPPLPPEPTLWEMTRQAHQALKQQTISIGGIVNVPDLTDAVQRQAPGLPAGGFHDLLRRWQEEGRLTLQLCNNPTEEPRAAEGIRGPHGLLFYVHLR